jgi:hypothetical protein
MKFLKQPWYVWAGVVLVLILISKTAKAVETAKEKASVPPSGGGVDTVFGISPQVVVSRPKISTLPQTVSRPNGASPGAINWVTLYPKNNGILR